MAMSAADAPDRGAWTTTDQPAYPTARRTKAQTGQERVGPSGRWGPRVSSSASNALASSGSPPRIRAGSRRVGDTSTGLVAGRVAGHPGGRWRERRQSVARRGPGRLVRRYGDGPGAARATEVAGQDEPAIADHQRQMVRSRARGVDHADGDVASLAN